MSAGTLEVLNCGEGDIEIVITENNPIEIERARRIITDMLRRGYALFIHGPGDNLVRVRRFKADTLTYVIADRPETETVPLPSSEPASLPPPKRGRGRPRPREIKATETKATVVGRSAGG